MKPPPKIFIQQKHPEDQRPVGNHVPTFDSMYNNIMTNNRMTNIPQNREVPRNNMYNTYTHNPMFMQRRNTNFIRNPNNLANMFTDFWTSVPVYPTNEQIANATRNVPYSAERMNGQTCPITMTEFNEASQILEIRECGHIFNENALRRWFRNHVTCPVCRCDIRRSRQAQTTDLDASSSETNTNEPLPNPPEENEEPEASSNLNLNRIYYDVFIDTIPLNTTNMMGGGNNNLTVATSGNNQEIVDSISNILLK